MDAFLLFPEVLVLQHGLHASMHYSEHRAIAGMFVHVSWMTFGLVNLCEQWPVHVWLHSCSVAWCQHSEDITECKMHRFWHWLHVIGSIYPFIYPRINPFIHPHITREEESCFFFQIDSHAAIKSSNDDLFIHIHNWYTIRPIYIIDRWTDGQMDGWIDGYMDRRIDG